jgi:hypothetical protein
MEYGRSGLRLYDSERGGPVTGGEKGSLQQDAKWDVAALSREELMALAQETYNKAVWLPEDVRTLRACWREFDKRGFGQPVLFFRPIYFDVLKFHEIDSGQVTEADVQRLENNGAEIAPDYRDIMRKLHDADTGPGENPEPLPQHGEWELVQELRRLNGDSAVELMECPCCGKPRREPRDARMLGPAEEFETFFQLGEHLEGSKLLARGEDWALWSTTMPEADHAHIWLFTVAGSLYTCSPDAETMRHILDAFRLRSSLAGDS